MNVKRREFLRTLGTGAVLSALPTNPLAGKPSEQEKEQELHRDYQSNNPGTEYFFVGNGLILGALQTALDPEAGTHCGLILMSPDHFGRKISTYLYHPERGLQNSRCHVSLGGTTYLPDPSLSTIHWEYPDDIPTVVAEWKAGTCSVREEFFCPINDPVIVRTVTVRVSADGAADVSCILLLYPNLMFFDEYDVDRVRGTLTASGYKVLRLFSQNPVTTGDRHMTVSLGSIAPSGEKSATFFLSLDKSREQIERKGLSRMREETKEYWRGKSRVVTGHKGLDHLFRVSVSGIRSAVSRSGKMDGSIWQYNLEWVRDQSMVAAGAAMCGQWDTSAALLTRILTRSVDEEGKTVDASRHRPPETIELDQNGELLYALYLHWTWSGDDSILRTHWTKIRNVADYVLRPEFRDPSIGLLKNTREYWEREKGFGVREGYENAYQLWNIVGLEMASRMAGSLNDSAVARRWLNASKQMKQAYLHHPVFSLVDQGRFIKRRLATGGVQRTFEPPNRMSMPKGMPLNVESVSYCDPDTSCALPIALGVVDPQSDLALKTLSSIEELWNQRWKTGGYGRYHVTSEPDSPGPWPFATMFVARAYYEAGDSEKVWRALQWLLELEGGKAGAWLEFYGDRPTPPLPPVGIVVWTWAEIVTLIVRNMLGVNPGPSTVSIRPKLLSGLNRLKADVKIRGHNLHLTVARDAESKFAIINGSKLALINGGVEIPAPTLDLVVELYI